MWERCRCHCAVLVVVAAIIGMLTYGVAPVFAPTFESSQLPTNTYTYALDGDVGMYSIFPGAMLSEGVALAVTVTTQLIGWTCRVNVTVSNTGSTTVTGVTAALSASSMGSISAVVSSKPPSGPVTLAPGAAAEFPWAFRIHYPGGTLRFVASASGTDSVSSATVTAQSAPVEVPILTRASLGMVIQASCTEIPMAGEITVTAVISNTGFADAIGVTISPWHVSGQGGMQRLSGPIPPIQDVPAAGSVTVAYTYRATNPGDVVFKGVATGTDIGAAAVIYSPEASSSTVTVLDSSSYSNLHADILAALEDATACAAAFHGCGVGSAHDPAIAGISALMATAVSFDNPFLMLGQLIRALDLMHVLGQAAGCACG